LKLFQQYTISHKLYLCVFCYISFISDLIRHFSAMQPHQFTTHGIKDYTMYTTFSATFNTLQNQNMDDQYPSINEDAFANSIACCDCNLYLQNPIRSSVGASK